MPVLLKTKAELDLMRRLGLLRSLDPSQLMMPHGGVLVTCGDGHQFRDLREHHIRTFHGEEPECLHVVALNGGALSIPHDSPLHNLSFTPELLGFSAGAELTEEQRLLLGPSRRDLPILQDTFSATVLKTVPYVCVYTHFPCAYAALANLSCEDVIELGVRAKERIKRLRPDLKVALFTHVDWEHAERGRVRATYHVPASTWRRTAYMPDVDSLSTSEHRSSPPSSTSPCEVA